MNQKILDLTPLSLKDKPLFDRLLIKRKTNFLSAQSFPLVWAWKDFFVYYWVHRNQNVYLLATHDGLWYMPFPPLGEGPLNEAVSSGFEIMDGLNRNRSHSRIENLGFYEMSQINLKEFKYHVKSWDYLYERLRLSGLKGDPYKGKRVSYNYFTKHHDPQYLPFSLKDAEECLNLYDRWMERKKFFLQEDPYEHYLMEDSRKAHQRMMKDSDSLSLIGRIVKIESEIKGYIFGAELNESTLIVMAEVTDLSVKGLAQYIFRRFCKEMERYDWINVMDDSGLSSLRKVKESYHPIQLIPSYVLSHQ